MSPRPKLTASHVPLWFVFVFVGKVCAAPKEMVFRLRRPQNLSVTNLYNDFLPTYASSTWQNAREPAQRGKDLLYSYLNFTDDPPPLSYKNLLDNDHSVIGLYRYGYWNGAVHSESIEIKNGLDKETEFFVAVHELLHFGGFGNVPTDNPAKIESATNHYKTEFLGFAEGDPVIDEHWESVSGTHIRSGQQASEEVMTPSIGGDAFLATSTLVACSRATTGSRNYCDENLDCEGNKTCILGQATTPGHCNIPEPTEEWPHTDSSNDAFVAILVSSLVVVVFVLIGLMIAWFDETHTRYDKLSMEL